MATSIKQTRIEVNRASQHISDAITCLRLARAEYTNLVDEWITSELNQSTCELRKVQDRLIEMKRKLE